MEKDGNKLELKLFEENKIMKLKNILLSLKVVIIITMIFSCIFAFTIGVLSIFTTYSVATTTNEQLLQNDIVIEYIAETNYYTLSEVTDVVKNIGNKGIFIIFDVIIPSLPILAAFVMLVFLCKKILDFIKDIKSNKTLFTTEKLNLLKKIRTTFFACGLLFFIALDLSYFILYLLLEITLEIILYLFNYCVKAENMKKE